MLYCEVPFRQNPEDTWEQGIQVEGTTNTKTQGGRREGTGGEARELSGVNAVLLSPALAQRLELGLTTVKTLASILSEMQNPGGL